MMAKAGLENVGDISFLLTRFALSTLIFFPFVRSAVHKMHLLKKQHLLAGVLTVAVHYYLQVVALRHVPVTWYVFFYALCPILNLFAVRAPFSIRNFGVGLLALSGTWLFVDLDFAHDISGPMLFALIVSVLGWVLFTVVVRSWQSVLTDAEVSATTSALSFLVFGSMAFLSADNLVAGWSLRAGGLTLLLSLLLPLAFFSYSYSLRKNASMAVLGQYSEPVFGTLGALLFLGEILSSRQVAGLLVTALALCVLILPKRIISQSQRELSSESL